MNIDHFTLQQSVNYLHDDIRYKDLNSCRQLIKNFPLSLFQVNEDSTGKNIYFNLIESSCSNSSNEKKIEKLALIDDLFEKGVDINSRGPNGENLYTFCLVNGYYKAISFLRGKNLDILSVDNEGKDVLMSIMEKSHRWKTNDFIQFIEMYKNKNKDFSLKDNSGNTYLHYAVKNNAGIKVIKELMKNNLSLYDKNNEGDTPYISFLKSEKEQVDFSKIIDIWNEEENIKLKTMKLLNFICSHNINMLYEDGIDLLKTYLDDKESKKMKDFIISLSIRKEKRVIQTKVNEIPIDSVIKHKKRM